MGNAVRMFAKVAAVLAIALLISGGADHSASAMDQATMKSKSAEFAAACKNDGGTYTKTESEDKQTIVLECETSTTYRYCSYSSQFPSLDYCSKTGDKTIVSYTGTT